MLREGEVRKTTGSPAKQKQGGRKRKYTELGKQRRGDGEEPERGLSEEVTKKEICRRRSTQLNQKLPVREDMVHL